MSVLRYAIGIFPLVIALPAAAVDVRGRVNFAGPTGTIPMARAMVELCLEKGECRQYVTGYDGMYYFSARPGPHIVKVNRVVRMHVTIPDQRQFDIQAIQGN